MLVATPCLAQPGSNIGLGQYPAPKCDKPQAVTATPPKKLPEKYTDDQAIAYNKQVDAYNAQLRARNAQMTAYNSCLQAYIANGNEDARRIRDALDAAVAEAKAP
jgi:hypothetical protein